MESETPTTEVRDTGAQTTQARDMGAQWLPATKGNRNYKSEEESELPEVVLEIAQ